MEIIESLRQRLEQKAEDFLFRVALRKAATQGTQALLAFLASEKAVAAVQSAQAALRARGVVIEVHLDPALLQLAAIALGQAGLEGLRNALKRKFPGLLGWL